jgi:hypothetical protein
MIKTLLLVGLLLPSLALASGPLTETNTNDFRRGQPRGFRIQ